MYRLFYFLEKYDYLMFKSSVIGNYVGKKDIKAFTHKTNFIWKFTA